MAYLVVVLLWKELDVSTAVSDLSHTIQCPTSLHLEDGKGKVGS